MEDERYQPVHLLDPPGLHRGEHWRFGQGSAKSAASRQLAIQPSQPDTGGRLNAKRRLRPGLLRNRISIRRSPGNLYDGTGGF